MKEEAELKVEGGKLLKAEVEFDSEIKQVRLHGDFFIHPAEELGKLEEALRGVPVETGKELLERKMEHSLSGRAELVGFETSDVADLVKEAVDDAG
ncbi:MAG: hypothetical protein MUP63_02440 [Candidatus Nanohaloarchaeota archaeon QJJ-7]|nr:hypothetical protein [Candidatus Nanohaloarchaeota archaeon QJJ-7]